MELTEKLEEATAYFDKKRADKRTRPCTRPVRPGDSGAGRLVAFTDWRNDGDVVAGQAEGRQVVESLMQPVQSLNRVMTDEQVQALAVRALENPEKPPDLTYICQDEWLSFSRSGYWCRPGLHSSCRPRSKWFRCLRDGFDYPGSGKGSMQMHYVMDPPLLHDSAVIKKDGEVLA